jgi:CubicO group peptidase (beta-lactamase class C family)
MKQKSSRGRFIPFILIILSSAVVTSCSPRGQTTHWPTESWPVSSPEEQGLDAALLDKIHLGLASGTHGHVNRFLMVRNGHVVVDQAYELNYELINAGLDHTPHQYNYYHPDWHPYYQGSDLHTLQSVTKGVVAIVIGIAIQRGELTDPSVAALDFFEDYEIENLDERKRRVTLEDLLTMRSGLEWDEWTYAVGDQLNSVTQLETSDDWIQFVLDHPMAHEPGEAFVYSSGAAQLLSVVVKKATGLHIDEYAEEHLFGPLGITEYYWKRTPKGWPDTEGGLYLKAEDLAKIGYLLLHEGVWEDEQIVSSEWVDEMTSPKVEDVFPDDPDQDWGYGYLWWTMGGPSAGAPRVYAALGYGGQYLFVIPELDLVAVFNGWNIYRPQPSVIDLFLEDILPTAGSR